MNSYCEECEYRHLYVPEYDCCEHSGENDCLIMKAYDDWCASYVEEDDVYDCRPSDVRPSDVYGESELF